jgi:hypothetical protein
LPGRQVLTSVGGGVGICSGNYRRAGPAGSRGDDRPVQPENALEFVTEETVV